MTTTMTTTFVDAYDYYGDDDEDGGGDEDRDRVCNWNRCGNDDYDNDSDYEFPPFRSRV